jgi:hypothetical protein
MLMLMWINATQLYKDLLQGVQKLPRKAPGTRFEAGNCISEPCPQEPYRDIFRNALFQYWGFKHEIVSVAGTSYTSLW